MADMLGVIGNSNAGSMTGPNFLCLPAALASCQFVFFFVATPLQDGVVIVLRMAVTSWWVCKHKMYVGFFLQLHTILVIKKFGVC